MIYDFETVRSKIDLASIKWDLIPKKDREAGVIPLSVADMEFSTAPEIIDAVVEYAQKGLLGYTWANEKYQAAVKKWMSKRHGWEINTKWIIPTPGVVSAIYTAVRAYTEPGDEIIIQPPVYHPFFDAISNNNRIIVKNSLLLEEGQYKMDLVGLEKQAKTAKMLILCSPHNPVGRVWREDELYSLAKICKKNDLIILSDEIHADIIMSGYKHYTFGRLDDIFQEKALIATSASKTFSLAGLNCSNILINNTKIKEKFEKQMEIDGTHFNSAFGVVATRAAYIKGEAWLDEMIAIVEGNYLTVKESLARCAPNLHIAPMEGTYLCWIDCRPLGLDSKELCVFMEKGLKICKFWNFLRRGRRGLCSVEFGLPRKCNYKYYGKMGR